MTSGEENQAATFRTAMPARYRGILGGLGFATVAGTVIAALEGGPSR
ncbi:hypothetical protein QNO08_16690 [Arthrobacter sp. zg-Y820]|nr:MULTISPECIES: hypothetical protein [unclassified Arthrobacter]MCC9197276.1 hypothetical protein [Arthrobacter sp. zg-Y820]MDK1280141.1 hypothetical protein [Arthrobacter sp. zg.Y820]WIB09433.1 hypothetical protein QNO08_16690 [Arthrobacter sp. zg-Y820]